VDYRANSEQPAAVATTLTLNIQNHLRQIFLGNMVANQSSSFKTTWYGLSSKYNQHEPDAPSHCPTKLSEVLETLGIRLAGKQIF